MTAICILMHQSIYNLDTPVLRILQWAHTSRCIPYYMCLLSSLQHHWHLVMMCMDFYKENEKNAWKFQFIVVSTIRFCLQEVSVKFWKAANGGPSPRPSICLNTELRFVWQALCANSNCLAKQRLTNFKRAAADNLMLGYTKKNSGKLKREGTYAHHWKRVFWNTGKLFNEASVSLIEYVVVNVLSIFRKLWLSTNWCWCDVMWCDALLKAVDTIGNYSKQLLS